MVTDPIGDFITRLKNAGMVRKTEVVIPHSRLKESIAMALKKAGYLTDVVSSKDTVGKMLTVSLAYDSSGMPVLQGVKRISKPGRRLYAGVSDIHQVKYGRGMMVISTPRGILSDSEARKAKVGGETLFTIW